MQKYSKHEDSARLSSLKEVESCMHGKHEKEMNSASNLSELGSRFLLRTAKKKLDIGFMRL